MMYICTKLNHWLKPSELKNGRCPFCGAAVVEDDVPEPKEDE